jgi:hypothetical protein
MPSDVTKGFGGTGQVAEFITGVVSQVAAGAVIFSTFIELGYLSEPFLCVGIA